MEEEASVEFVNARAVDVLKADRGSYGEDADIVKVSASIDTDTGQTTPTHIQPMSSGSAALSLFGIEIFGIIALESSTRTDQRHRWVA